MLPDLKNLTLEELEAFIAGFGKERYRARQIMKWLYHHRVSTFEEMTDLAKELRTRLSRKARISSLKLLAVQTSRDGSKKYLFELEDGGLVESVLIPEEGRLTLCISTQVGCAMGCRFCLTGKGGLARDLTTGEILNQILGVAQGLNGKERITNIVLMGMGEPLANYENVTRALKVMTADIGLGLSYRRVTLSTVGLIPQMKRLFKDGVRCRLAVSLNASTQKVRSYLMPISKKYPLQSLLETCRRLPLPPRERITFEYVLIRGINDSETDAQRLTRIIKGVRCKVNLIPYNECPDLPFNRPTIQTVLLFQRILIEEGYTALLRESRGEDISAACGQLRGRIKGS
ncbi:MAG: 23S rRNA (adenine(2503)-C(2))-methyltransferase RlmN [Deltaproteobacteria bacterium]|nr:MAG: 23S rRNA (adenine(2503)-C(2))-methyltransferase RlmN [Deltaproteobacteria bacterium]